MRKWLIAFRGL